MRIDYHLKKKSCYTVTANQKFDPHIK